MNKNILNMAEMDRRALLKAAGMGALALTGAGIASTANATPEEAAAYLGKVTGGAKGMANSPKVTINLPEIAENGATVPLTVLVDSPMTSGDHVKQIHVVAEGNPIPEVISFNLTPANGKAEVSTRMR
ncbi:MAG: thiosulfate oxidation carrier protein SoxY, partial [Rhodospirillaceae bacterium]|nr:thiosulfate oxidation carrier protein SoxY [Rhodospirillaceae bacterium]